MRATISRGDTLIEVMFSFAVFSLLIVGSMALMNKGQAMAERSLEITLVREQVDAQVAMVQYAQQTDPTLWKSLINPSTGKLASSLATFGGVSSCPKAGDSLLQQAFFFTATADKSGVLYQPVTAVNFAPADTYSRVDYLPSAPTAPAAHGLWMQIIKSETNAGSTQNAYDLHVNACWDSVGSDIPMTIGTVVRLYDGS